jgi:hypothetical protein
MTKIKNFRIHLRSREIARWLKANHQIATTPEVEAAVGSAINRLKPLVQTAAIYTTLTRATAEKATPVALPGKSVAVSVIAASIGARLGEYRAQLDTAVDAMEPLFAAAVGEEALHQSVQFALRLLQDQAKEEECEMSGPVLSEDPTLLSPLTSLLGSRRIGIEVDAAIPLSPYARVAWSFWTPLVKQSARRGDSSRAKAAA